MSNRYKFRVWNFESKIYRDASEDGVFVLSPGGELVRWDIRDGMYHLADRSRFVAEQCTGLEDKDGTLIYEGDILEIKRHVFLEEFKVERHAVEYSQMLARWRLGKSCIYLNKDTAAECKIVGNVHENAELLEVKK